MTDFIETFTAQCGSGPKEVPIVEHVSILGIPGFVVHWSVTGPGLLVVSCIATGRRMPGRPATTPAIAVKRCLAALKNAKIFREDLEERIVEGFIYMTPVRLSSHRGSAFFCGAWPLLSSALVYRPVLCQQRRRTSPWEAPRPCSRESSELWVSSSMPSPVPNRSLRAPASATSRFRSTGGKDRPFQNKGVVLSILGIETAAFLEDQAAFLPPQYAQVLSSTF